jgi:hypothetical protein
LDVVEDGEGLHEGGVGDLGGVLDEDGGLGVVLVRDEAVGRADDHSDVLEDELVLQ